MGWLAGSSQEQPEHPAPAPEPTATFDPPNDDVKREMLRMEIAAIEARTEAERSALEAELGIAARAAVPHVDLDREAVLSEDTTDDGTGQPG